MSRGGRRSKKATRRPLVAVVGDARATVRSRPYRLARQLGRQLVDQGFRVLTGGLGGVMEAASRGAREASEYRSGDTVGLLPGLDPEEANPHVDIVIATGLGDFRNGLVANADAVIAVGGGAGTLSEIALAWTRRRLIVAVRSEGWAEKLMGLRLDGRPRKVEIEDDRVFEAETPEEAVRIVARLWRSYRRRPRGLARPGGGAAAGEGGS